MALTFEKTSALASPGSESRSEWTALAVELAADARPDDHGEPEQAEALAQAVCRRIVLALWDRLTGEDRRFLPPSLESVATVPSSLASRVAPLSDSLRDLGLIEAAYRIGLLYTDLLPADVRSARGAYYTPPVLAERLLDIAATAGVSWSDATVLDPACGGGAFLLPVAARITTDASQRSSSPEEQLEHIETHLAGIEIDPFAAWMTRAFLQLMTYQISREAGRPLRLTVRTGDALHEAIGSSERFDLVVANPPFGRVTLPARLREGYARSLYGHANLYGVFLDAALRWRKLSGLVAFLIPTSFLGGQYFTRLRALLLQEAPPLILDLVTDRTGVFPSVQQETCLAVFGPNPEGKTSVNLVSPNGEGLNISRAGLFPIDGAGRGVPWLLPRSPAQARVARHAAKMKTRLHTLGYRASTGPLVWNRLKDRLRSRQSNGAYPLIWAEAVRPNGFRFEYRVRSRHCFVAVSRSQSHLLMSRPCVLVQRTTAKEQKRRLVACHVPGDFMERWGKIVVENHVNVLWTSPGNPVTPRALAAVLNTSAVDEVFRCISGSVAVSATELHALPLPGQAVFEQVERSLRRRASLETYEAIERIVAEAYGQRASRLAR